MIPVLYIDKHDGSITEPIPSKCPGWYAAEGEGRRAGFTSDPAQAKRRPIKRREDEQ